MVSRTADGLRSVERTPLSALWIHDGRNSTILTGGLILRDLPDGTKIAFTRFKALKKQVWLMDAYGGNEEQLTELGTEL